MNENELIDNFKKIFNESPQYYVDTGGRYEIIGNHTDHNHGLCLVANSSLRIKAVVKKNENMVRVQSEGYPYFEFALSDLKEDSKESRTCSLLKGVLFKLKEDGYKIGGFDCFISSEIPDGSGVSSSAAIESLYGYMLSYLYNDLKIEPIVVAKIGQYSENNYFHKPSGLLDQIGTSFNSFNFIDFKNIDSPLITTLPFKLPLQLYLICSLGDHSNLTDLYAQIPYSMNEVARLLDNKTYLRDVEDTKDIFDRIENLDISDEIKRKAKHFFIENQNVLDAKKAIEHDDVEAFLSAIRASQESSRINLENTFVKEEYEGSPQNIIDDAKEFLNDEKGAIRIHGGGFKGTVIAFIKNEYIDEFDNYLKGKYPSNRYYKVNISSKAFNYKKY